MTDKKVVYVYVSAYTKLLLDNESELLNMTRSRLVEKIVEKYFKEKEKNGRP